LRTWVHGVTRFSNLARYLDRQKDAFRAFFLHLRQNFDPQQLRFSEMRNLTRNLGIHPLLLDPLLSKSVSQQCLSIHLPTGPPDGVGAHTEACAVGEFRQAGEKGGESYGSGRYAIPTGRLASTDAAFVYVILDPKAHSDDHHHPGDELLFVLKGSATVYLRGSGSEIELQEGSYVHFYSEQTHAAYNYSDTEAHLFIVRFY